MGIVRELDIKAEQSVSEELAEGFQGASLNTLAQVCHRRSKAAGWWNDCDDWETHSATFQVAQDKKLLGTKIALIHSEASEMLEGLRKGVKDSHLPRRSMEEVECADLMIRIFDYAGARGLDLEGALIEKLSYNAIRNDHKLDVRVAEGGKVF